MSTPRSPRRLPRRVYVVRRILVLLLLAVLIGLIVFAVRWLWPDEDPAPETSSTPTVTDTPTVEPTPEAEPTPEPATTRLVQVATAVEDCDPTLISLRPSSAEQEAEGPVTIYLSITTAQESACTLDLEPRDVIATINSGGGKIWDSSPCETAVLEEPVTVAPGWVTNVAVEWSGRRSGSNCNGGEEYARPGDYTLQIATRGGEPGRSRIRLTEPPEPEPEPESDDEESDEGGSEDEEGGSDEEPPQAEDQVPESEAD